MSTTLATERLQATFGDSPLEVASVDDRRTERSYGGSRQTILVRMPDDVSEPVFLREVTCTQIDDESLCFCTADDSNRFESALMIEPSACGLHFRLHVTAPEPLWMVEWTLGGLDLERVIVPALGGQMLTGDMPAHEQVSYKYPFWWNAQFVVGSAGEEQGGLWLRTTECRPRLKLLRVKKEHGDSFALTLGFEANAPLTENTLSAEWYLDTYEGAWTKPVETHRAWMEESFDLTARPKHPHAPDWVEGVYAVLELWGMRRHQGRAGHTFEAMTRRLEAFAERHPPEHTLVYLPGFAEGGLDSRIPDYQPGEKLGGADGFEQLVDAAHDLGYRVMIHTNVLGMTYSHSHYDEFEAHQVVDVFGRKQGWAMDMDGDWLTEPYFAYIHPGAEVWGDLMEDRLGALIERYELDAILLDQTLLAFNAQRETHFLDGMRQHVQRLQQAYPNMLFAGEGLHEYMLPALPVAQIHGLDSITDVHGMEDPETWRRVHPVSKRLFGHYTKFLPHLLTRHPSHPAFEQQEEAYAVLDVVPAAVFYDDDQDMDHPAFERVLERARRHRDDDSALSSTI